jgi:phosphoribosylamine--glycine ligase
MKILVIGSGGREHALAWKLARDSSRPEVSCAPGNAGTALLCTNLDIAATDLQGLLAWAKKERPGLIVVGPEAPLCAGAADLFAAEKLRVFGPCSAAARLEGSKIFSKDVMVAAGVPVAKAQVFTDAAKAKAWLREQGAPVVVKADGLAAGKGVTVCTSTAQAESAIDEALIARAFGDAGASILVEECLQGEEASILALIDGEHVVMLASAQDHKRINDGDQGPNTGGMGAYSPAPIVTDKVAGLVREQVFDRTLAELRRRGIDFRGLLYAGVMMTQQGPKVLEFNVRFGDPETQAILPRWDGDMLPALQACVDGTLSDRLVHWKNESAVCVVMAAGGYPGSYATGAVIEGLDAAARMPGVTVFHAGTKLVDGNVVTAGGRVLGVTATGADLPTAIERAYAGAGKIRFDKAHYRRDIAWRAIRGSVGAATSVADARATSAAKAAAPGHES